MHSLLSPWYNQRGQNRRGSCGPAAPVPRLPRVIKEGNLSAKELRRIWKDEFLPSIRREIKTKTLELKSSIKALTVRKKNRLPRDLFRFSDRLGPSKAIESQFAKFQVIAQCKNLHYFIPIILHGRNCQ